MMRKMREIAKPVFWVVAITFIGWLAYGQVTEIFSGGRDVVLKVNGREVRLPEYNAALQSAYEQIRRQTGGTLTREEEQQAQNQVVDQLTQLLLLEQQYKKLGITVTNEELVQAAQSSPPPEVMQAAEFQTNGQFDITKWQRFIASASDPQFLQSLEARYRQQIPQMKLVQYLTADLYVSDPKLWRIYRDQHESVTAAVLAIRPEQIPDQDAPVLDAELQRYYEGHKADFKRPAVALLSYIAQPRQPYPEDSAAALARARQIRAQIS
jgi:peptidyl-prolyl cis-trans isomerase D